MSKRTRIYGYFYLGSSRDSKILYIHQKTAFFLWLKKHGQTAVFFVMAKDSIHKFNSCDTDCMLYD